MGRKYGEGRKICFKVKSQKDQQFLTEIEVHPQVLIKPIKNFYFF